MQMAADANRKYLETEILSADPITLVRRLYGGALEALGQARTLLRAGDIRGRARAVTRAHAILTELAQSLDHARGGELSERLAALYDYAQCKLLDGNFLQQDAPFAEVEGLLRTLLEGWEQCQRAANSVYQADLDTEYQADSEYESVSVAG